MEKLKRTRTLLFGSSMQDRMLRLMLTETSILGQIRSFWRAAYFDSPLAKNICIQLFDFYDVYMVAPNFDQLDAIIGDMVERKLISDDEIEIYVTYLDRIINDVSVDSVIRSHILDKARDYARNQIMALVTKACTRGIQQKKHPSELVQYINEALSEYSNVNQQAKLLTLDRVIEMYDTGIDTVTCFNVPSIDAQLSGTKAGGGLQRGLFYVVLGYTSAGKTWMMVHLGKMAARFGMLTVHVVVELSNKIVGKRYKQAMSSKYAQELYTNHKYINNVVRRSMLNRANIILLDEEEKSQPIDNLEVIRKRIIKEYGRQPDLWLIDSAEDYLPPGNKKYKDKWEAETATFTYLKDFAKLDTCVVTTAQAVKTSEKVDWLTASHCSGAAAKIRKAMGAVSINSSQKEKDFGVYRLSVFKHTEGESGAKAWVQRNFTRGQAVIQSGSLKTNPDGGKVNYFEWLKRQQKPPEET